MVILRKLILTLAVIGLTGCGSKQPVIDESVPSFVGGMPADLSGSWAKDYTRSDDLQSVLNYTLRRMYRPIPDSAYPAPTQDPNEIIALARLAELITRPDELTITQDEYEIRVSRKDDFTMQCEFYDGYAKRTQSEFGAEVCSWSGRQLISQLVLPDGLRVNHRFTLSTDGNQLLVTTTVSSSGIRDPFTIRRAYVKFEPPESDFNCIETLSMKRVCSTGEIVP